ncbi:MAG: hypothetical protein N2645_10080 [Clostridia bacterium]|nr:hypothetical protein [Clostridia bacterium]
MKRKLPKKSGPSKYIFNPQSLVEFSPVQDVGCPGKSASVFFLYTVKILCYNLNGVKIVAEE